MHVDYVLHVWNVERGCTLYIHALTSSNLETSLAMVAITSKAVQFARQPNMSGGLGQCLPAFHDEDQQQLH